MPSARKDTQVRTHVPHARNDRVSQFADLKEAVLEVSNRTAKAAASNGAAGGAGGTMGAVLFLPGCRPMARILNKPAQRKAK